MQICKLPGVTSRNVFGLLNAASDLPELLEFSEDDLESAMGGERENALLLHRALHEKPQQQGAAANAQQGGGEGTRRERPKAGKRFKSKNAENK